jgi:hypothetical protein
MSFFSILYKKHSKSSEKVKWIDSSVRMACPFLYHNILFSLIHLLKKQQPWTDIWQFRVFFLFLCRFGFDRITCSFGISNFVVAVVALRMSSDRQACGIYTRFFLDCLHNDLTGLIYHKLLSTIVKKKKKMNRKKKDILYINQTIRNDCLYSILELSGE